MQDSYNQLKEHIDYRATAIEEIAKELKGDMRTLNHILTGNGNPESGFVHRVVQIETAIKAANLPELVHKTNTMYATHRDYKGYKKAIVIAILGTLATSAVAAGLAIASGRNESVKGKP